MLPAQVAGDQRGLLHASVRTMHGECLWAPITLEMGRASMSACQSTTKLVANLHAFVRLNIVGRHHNAAALQALAGPSGAKTWRGVGVYEPPHMSPPPLPRPLLHPRVASRISHGAGTPCSHHACRTELALQWAWLCVRGLTATLLVPVAAWCRSNRCRRSGARCVNRRELACHGSGATPPHKRAHGDAAT